MSKFTVSTVSTMSTMYNHQCLGIQRDNIFDKYISRKNERSHDNLCFSPFLRSYTRCLGVSSSQGQQVRGCVNPWSCVCTYLDAHPQNGVARNFKTYY